MKFKSLFLTMLSAAAIVSCNNENIIDGPNGGGGDTDVIEGVPIYASMTFKLGSAAKTYAGATEVPSSSDEEKLSDAVVYIYKSDASGMTPQCAVYLNGLSATASGIPANGDYNTVTLKTTSGNKKIFVAANVNKNNAGADMVKITNPAIGITSTEVTVPFASLNSPLYSTATAFQLTAPATAVFGAAGPSEGLILNLAMSDLYGSGAATYTGADTQAPLMTNWDGPNDVAGGLAQGGNGASFALQPDIDSITSRPTTYPAAGDDAINQLNIYVQRAYAKVSLKFGMPATSSALPAQLAGLDLAAKYYKAAMDTLGNENGRFFPWGAGTEAYWSMGNITTAELPFQQYVNGFVQDMFYQVTTDSISSGNEWFLHYDNTRVFPFNATPISTYPNTGITVSNTKTTMLGADNYLALTGDQEATLANYNYAYATENARLNPVTHDHATYSIVGGFYQPKYVVTSINRAKVSTNDPILAYNDVTLTGSETQSQQGTAFNWYPSAAPNDTLYYIADDAVFIEGRANLMAYYAWSQLADQSAGDDYLTANPTAPAITAQAVYDYAPGNGAAFGPDVMDAINADIENEVLFAYYQGQCFYRIFIQNNDAPSAANEVAVLRNHIYDVAITSIKGPGIADPNKILIPGKPVLEQDTYVSATINVLPWHKVNQNTDVDNQ